MSKCKPQPVVLHDPKPLDLTLEESIHELRRLSENEFQTPRQQALWNHVLKSRWLHLEGKWFLVENG